MLSILHHFLLNTAKESRLILLFAALSLSAVSQTQTGINAIDLPSSASPAEFHGGTAALYQFLGDNIDYPREARERGIKGTVIIEFRVKENTKVDEIRTVQSAHSSLDAVLKDAIALTSKRWTPSMSYDSIPIASRYHLSFDFRITDRIDTLSVIHTTPVPYHTNKYGPVTEVIYDQVDLPEYLILGDQAMKMKKYKKAARLYGRAYRGDPNNPTILIKKANAHLILQDIKATCTALKKAVKLENNEAKRLYELNCIY